MVKIAHVSEFFELEANPEEGQSLQQKGKKRRKWKGQNKNQKSHMPQQKCCETRCYWKERHGVMLQTPF